MLAIVWVSWCVMRISCGGLRSCSGMYVLFPSHSLFFLCSHFIRLLYFPVFFFSFFSFVSHSFTCSPPFSFSSSCSAPPFPASSPYHISLPPFLAFIPTSFFLAFLASFPLSSCSHSPISKLTPLPVQHPSPTRPADTPLPPSSTGTRAPSP
jgi:hypothetical protein